MPEQMASAKSAHVKRVIAREWLIFVVCLLVAGSVLPIMLWLMLAPTPVTPPEGFIPDVKPVGLRGVYGEFYAALLSKADAAAAWALLFGPYLVVQLVRSIWWAYRIVRTTKAR